MEYNQKVANYKMYTGKWNTKISYSLVEFTTNHIKLVNSFLSKQNETDQSCQFY